MDLTWYWMIEWSLPDTDRERCRDEAENVKGKQEDGKKTMGAHER